MSTGELQIKRPISMDEILLTMLKTYVEFCNIIFLTFYIVVHRQGKGH